jgi:hypothetical protein
VLVEPLQLGSCQGLALAIIDYQIRDEDRGKRGKQDTVPVVSSSVKHSWHCRRTPDDGQLVDCGWPEANANRVDGPIGELRNELPPSGEQPAHAGGRRLLVETRLLNRCADQHGSIPPGHEIAVRFKDNPGDRRFIEPQVHELPTDRTYRNYWVTSPKTPRPTTRGDHNRVGVSGTGGGHHAREVLPSLNRLHGRARELDAVSRGGGNQRRH